MSRPSHSREPLQKLKQSNDFSVKTKTGIWEKGTYSILKVRVTHLDAKTHQKKTAEKVSQIKNEKRNENIWMPASNSADISHLLSCLVMEYGGKRLRPLSRSFRSA